MCDLSETTDLTGTVIKADKEIAVFSGHSCANVPFDRPTCDHLEEQLFPLETWGTHAIGTNTISLGGDLSVYRVVSGEAGNHITFDPPVHPSVDLDLGEYVEFSSSKDFEVRGSGRLMLTQFMVGQGVPVSGQEVGDPAMALVIPVEQYLNSCRFIAPESFDENYINVVLPAGSSLELDGASVPENSFTAVGVSGYQVAKLPIAGGAHALNSSARFSVIVYGVGSYTSYMYPGGLNLNHILK